MKSLPGLTLATCAVLVAAWASNGFLSAQPPQSSSRDAEKPTAQDGQAEQADRDGAATEADSASDTESPDKLFKAARDRLVGYRSIKARIVEVVALGDRRFKATGSYLQGTNLKLRLEYKVQVGSSEASLLEVCDGYVLWTRHTIADEPKITRRDVRQILSARSNTPESMLVAELGLGGVPALMASIRDTMKLESVRDETIDGKPFKVVEGRWNDAFLDSWQHANPRAGRQLPEHVPDRIRIYFNEKSLFPQRIVYLKQDEKTKTRRAMVTLDFLDVVLNGAVSENEFYFVPPDGVVQEDITNLYLQRLKALPGAQSPAPKQ